MEKLIEIYKGLLDRTEIVFVRYLHEEIEWSSKLIAVVGARGVGKTTLLLQRIKLYHNVNDTLYVNADDLYFTENTLFDLASIFYKNGGKHLFIDEVHKYENWSKEIKMIYDYYQDLQVVFTGSSILDIYRGSDDLSRRALTYKLEGMSFREYLNMSQGLQLPVYSLEDILSNKIVLKEIEHPIPLFKQYLEAGYYPFFKEEAYSERLRNVINITLEVDIPVYAKINIATSKKIKQLLYVISQSVPFKPNFSKIAEIVGVHRNQVVDFLFYLEKAGIVTQLRTETKGIRMLGKVEKVYLNNPNLIYAIAEGSPEIGNMRETFFLNQLLVKNKVIASGYADFKIGEYTFEVGGRNKKQKQIEGIDNAFIVKDDIEYGYLNTIPLWAFGFNY